MRHKFLTANLMVLLVSAGLYGQAQSAASYPAEASHKTSSTHGAHYIDPQVLRLDLILPTPPLRSSAITIAELAELHGIETARTPAQIAQAQADDQEQDIFIFKTVLGPDFTAEAFPVTAALSARVHQEESAASGPLKNIYHRARPYQVDSTLHPVCPLNPGPTSYPSGHSLSGYLLAFTLVQLVPEKQKEILERADEYAHNRLICGVHYASDTEASRSIAYAIFGSLVTSANFQRDVAAAREETRRKLNVSAPLPQ
jgi:acid phosphatase (class A)